MRETIDTTYAGLRPSDLVIDKSGQAWPCDEVTFTHNSGWVTFWLLDPVTKVKMHNMRKVMTDPVKVSRLPTQADEASKLEAEFPATVGRLSTSPEEQAELQEKFPKDWAPAGTVNDSYLPDSHATTAEAVAVVQKYGIAAAEKIGVGSTMAEAVAAVEEIGGTVEAEVTAAEVDAAAAAALDNILLTLIPFADMTPLEARSHLYLLHGCYAHDMQSRDTLSTWHSELHSESNTVKSKTVPHVHAASTDAKSHG